MRCLSLAEGFKEKGEVVIFITADESASRLISRKGFSNLVLHTKWDDMDSELSTLIPIIEENAIELLLVDSYYVTEYYMTELRKHTKAAYIDDLGDDIFPVDILLNYNIYAPELSYEKKYRERVWSVPKMILGSRYAMLRGEFWHLDYQAGRKVRNVLITTGGGDICNFAVQLLAHMTEQTDREISSLNYHVVSGIYNTHINELKELAAKKFNIKIYENIKNMSELMMNCDVAISAAGSTMYELAAIGVPTICFSFADNQVKIGEAFGKEAAVYAGKFEKEPEHVIKNVTDGLEKLVVSRDMRLAFSQKMNATTDGRGAARIAEQMIAMRYANMDIE